MIATEVENLSDELWMIREQARINELREEGE